jgi:hypothetical protein
MFRSQLMLRYTRFIQSIPSVVIVSKSFYKETQRTCQMTYFLITYNLLRQLALVFVRILAIII